MRNIIAIFSLFLILSVVAKDKKIKKMMVNSSKSLTAVAQVLKDKEIKEGKNGHKFVLLSSGKMVVSLTGKKKPKHKKLAEGGDVISAGYINLVMGDDGKTIKEVTIDNKSGKFCPSFGSLLKVERVIKKYVSKVDVEKIDNPSSKCEE